MDQGATLLEFTIKVSALFTEAAYVPPMSPQTWQVGDTRNVFLVQSPAEVRDGNP